MLETTIWMNTKVLGQSGALHGVQWLHLALWYPMLLARLPSLETMSWRLGLHWALVEQQILVVGSHIVAGSTLVHATTSGSGKVKPIRSLPMRCVPNHELFFITIFGAPSCSEQEVSFGQKPFEDLRHLDRWSKTKHAVGLGKFVV